MKTISMLRLFWGLSFGVLSFVGQPPALASEWLTSNEARALYSGAKYDTESRGVTRQWTFMADGRLIGSTPQGDFNTYWWVQSGGAICSTTTSMNNKSGSVCWRHKKDDPNFIRYHPTRDQVTSSDRKLIVSGAKSAVKLPFVNPINTAIFSQVFDDNLKSIKVENAEESIVLERLILLKEHLLAGDASSLRAMVSDNFKKNEKIASETISSLDKNAAFDFGKTATRYKNIDFSLKEFLTDVPGGLITATLTSSYHGKYFTTRYLEFYSFGFENGVSKLKQQVRTRIMVSNPELHKVQIYLVKPISKNAIKEAFSSPNVDEKLDKLLEKNYEIWPYKTELNVLFLFREAPIFGSTIRTHIADKYFEEKVDSVDPYYLLSRDAYWGVEKFRVNSSIFVDGEFVAHRSIASE